MLVEERWLLTDIHSCVLFERRVAILVLSIKHKFALIYPPLHIFFLTLPHHIDRCESILWAHQCFWTASIIDITLRLPAISIKHRLSLIFTTMAVLLSTVLLQLAHVSFMKRHLLLMIYKLQ